MYIIADLDECKGLMLETLKFIDRICKKNKIQYSLAAGTLLGAYRHKGFIPWDDDIDIVMPRKDYEKFVDIMKRDKNEDFYILHKDTMKGYPFEFAKIMMRDTIVVIDDGGSNMVMNRGIFVDIFTLDSYNKKLSKKYRKRIRQFENGRKKIVIDAINSNLFKIGLKCFRSISKIVIPINLVNRAINKYVTDEGPFVGYAVEQADELFCNKSKYFPLKTIMFENEMFPCPRNVEAVLEAEYGMTYMKLPPESERLKHFEYGAITLNKALKFGVDIEGRPQYEYNEVFEQGGTYEGVISNSTSI